jgi:predicted RND superfamily exporter protein
MVFFVVSLVLRSWRFTLAAIPPNLLPVAVVLGAMGLSGIRLDIATVTIAAVVLGIVVDDTVHILYRLRRELQAGRPVEEAMRRVARASGTAVVSSSIVFCAGFLVVAMAGAYSIANVGLLTATAVAAALVTDLVMLPAIVSYLFGRHQESTAAHGTSANSGGRSPAAAGHSGGLT